MATPTATSRREQRKGWLYLSLFAFLIIAGVIVKRVFHHPDFIMFFHLPAAVFLILAGYKVPAKLKQRYRQDCDQYLGRSS